MVVEEVAVLVVLVRRHRHAVRAAVRRALDDEVPGAIKEETGPAAVRRVFTAPGKKSEWWVFDLRIVVLFEGTVDGSVTRWPLRGRGNCS